MKLKLENFGIFPSKEFPIDRVTVFTGPNESGKTTILDAFVSALVKVSGNNKYGAILNERYQEKRNADLGIPKQTLNPNLYLNSLVIREGNMDVGSDKELIKVIEQSIFDSGYNPSKLKEKAIQQTEKTGTRKVAKDWNLALSELEAAKQEFFEAEKVLHQVSSQFVELPSWELERQKKIAELQTLQKEQTQSLSALEELKQKEQHAEADRVYQQILQWEVLVSANREDGKVLQPELEKQAKQLEEFIRSQKQKLASQKEQIIAWESQKDNLILTKSNLDSKFQKMESYFPNFESWKDTLRKFQEDSPRLSKVKWNITYLSLAIVSLAFALFSSLVGIVSDLGNWPYVVGGAFFITSILVFAFRAREIISEKDETKWNEMVRRIASEMEMKTLGEWKPDTLQFDSLQLTFQRFEREYTKLKLELQTLLDQIKKWESDILTLQNQSKKDKEQLEESEKKLNSFFQTLGVRSLTELSEQLVQMRLKSEKIKTFEDLFRLEEKKWGCVGIEALKLKLKDKIGDWEKKGIGKHFQIEDQSTKQRLENKLLELSTTIRNLEKDNVELEKKLDTGKKVLESQIVPAQSRWEISKKNLESKEKKKHDFEKNYHAFEVLAKIFSEMEVESQDKMSSLVKSLQSRIDAMKGNLPSKQIQWNGFSDEIQVVSDKNNLQMSFVNLSTGTKEQISYVLRLEYAFRIGNQYQIPYLLLDEPFRHMDDERRDAALEYTLQCIVDAGKEWKVVFFSFDEDLVKRIKDLAEKWKLPCQIHSLTKQVS